MVNQRTINDGYGTGMEQISVLKILTAICEFGLMMCDCIWFSALFAGLPLFFFHFPHVKVWYGWNLFWSVSSVRGRSAWPTAKYVFSHYSLPSRWPWSSTTCRILCEGLGRQWRCGPEKCWRDRLLPVMTKKSNECSIGGGNILQHWNWWKFHPIQSQTAGRSVVTIASEPVAAEALCTTFASKRARGLYPTNWIFSLWVEPAQEKKNKSNS